MPTSNVVSSHSEMVYSQGSTSLAASAATTNGTAVGGSGNTLIPTYFNVSSFNIFINYRAFLAFDLSSLSGTVTGVTLTVFRRTSATSPTLHFLASEASDSVGTSDYQDGLVGATGYPFTSDVTSFGSQNMNADGGGDGDSVTFTLNSAAVTHANSVIGSGKFKVAIVNEFDLNNTYASSGIGDAFAVQGAYFSSTQHSTSGLHPVLNVTTADADAVQGVGNVTLNGAKIQIVSGKFLID
tara:strand:+ start:45 stop:764 length:720 start_codon:yes stop_codon:yes gene_type:complete